MEGEQVDNATDDSTGKKGHGKKGQDKGKHYALADSSDHKGFGDGKSAKKGHYKGNHYAVADTADPKGGYGKGSTKSHKSGNKSKKGGGSGSASSYGPKPPRQHPYWRW